MDNFIPDKIILGHNQFFGTDHMSAEKGAEKADYFSKIENVIHIIRFAYENGATGLMLSTHENTKLIIDEIAKELPKRNFLNIDDNETTLDENITTSCNKRGDEVHLQLSNFIRYEKVTEVTKKLQKL